MPTGPEAAGWRTLRELDEAAGLPKGSAFRAFKALEGSLSDGRDFSLLDAGRDADRIAVLGSRAYASSRNVLLFSPECAQRLLESLQPAPAAGSLAFELRRRSGVLELLAHHHPQYGAIRADWTGPDVQRRIAAGKKQLLARAVALPKNPGLSILDATAGLGRDGYTLAALGARVTMCERNPTVAALLRDAHARALADPAAAEAAARIAIVEADGRTLWGPGSPRFDVVYADPMYPHQGKTALAGKEMQLLRELTGGDPDADGLLEANARLRVVVKRPVKAPPLAGAPPSLALTGTQARFDIYLSQPGLKN